MDNKFVIKHAGVDVISIADVPAGAEYFGVILDALRSDKQVGYQRAGDVEMIQVTRAPVKALKSAEPPAPRKKIRRRRRVSQPRPDAEQAPDAPMKAAADAVARTRAWQQGDIVFLAWSAMSAAQREAYADMRESMGTVEEFRRGQGIKRTIGVKLDDHAGINWFHPDELSDKCESCIEERNREMTTPA